MHLLDSIREILHELAGVLIWPVILALLGLVAMIIVSLGNFARDTVERRRRAYRRRDHALQNLDAIAADVGPDLDLRLEQVLQEIEHRWRRSLDRARLAVRVGPSLGLMGTLIPMANALSALANGNLPSLAGNMVTAFAATVIGLAISVVAYLLGAARQEWLEEDMRNIRFHAEGLLRQTKTFLDEVSNAVR